MTYIIMLMWWLLWHWRLGYLSLNIQKPHPPKKKTAVVQKLKMHSRGKEPTWKRGEHPRKLRISEASRVSKYVNLNMYVYICVCVYLGTFYICDQLMSAHMFDILFKKYKLYKQIVLKYTNMCKIQSATQRDCRSILCQTKMQAKSQSKFYPATYPTLVDSMNIPISILHGRSVLFWYQVAPPLDKRHHQPMDPTKEKGVATTVSASDHSH